MIIEFMETPLFRRLSRCLAVLACLIPWQLLADSGDPQLSASLSPELRALDRMRKGRNTPLDEVSAEGMRLLAAYPRPEDQGQIFFQMTHVFAQSGLKDPDETIALAQKAMELPLSAHQRMTVHVYCGDAIRASKTQGAYPEQRRRAARTYFAALKEVASLNLPSTPPDLPVMELRDDIGTDPEDDRRDLQEQQDRRKEIESQRQMIRHRDVLRQQILSIYGRWPDARAELASLSEESLGTGSSAAEYLITHVKTPKRPAVSDIRTEPHSPDPPPSGTGRTWLLLANGIVLLGIIAYYFLKKRFRQVADEQPAGGKKP